MHLLNEPRANQSDSEVERRLEALESAHMRPLVDYVRTLRSRYPSVEFPDFDPLGGGVEAEILFLLEKPGPKTSRQGGGSGFISACNDDPTAEAMWRFMESAEIPIDTTVHWNVIPGWDGTRRYFNRDVTDGVPLLLELIELLPRLRAVILAGIPAGKAAPLIKRKRLPVIRSDHPGPMVRARYPQRWNDIPKVWREGLANLEDRGG